MMASEVMDSSDFSRATNHAVGLAMQASKMLTAAMRMATSLLNGFIASAL